MPHTVSPLKCLDPELEKHLAENSVIGDPEVIGHFVSLLVDPSTPKDIQSQLLHYILHIKAFKPFQTGVLEKSLPKLLDYLFDAIFVKSSDTQNLPMLWLEARMASLKAYAIEHSAQLQPSVSCRCKVLNGKQLVFTYVDSETAGGHKVI